MDFLELAKKRYSCRSYKNNPVLEEYINLILEAGRVAPSAANFQPWHFIVVKEKKNMEKLYQAYEREWFKTAPVIIVICGNHSISWKRKDGKDFCDIDIAITVDHITLQAAELDLATCWICNFDAKLCSKLLKLPKYIEPIVLLSLGYPLDKTDFNRHSSKRKSLKKIYHKEFFRS